MPELPEVEHLRRTLARSLIGRRVTRVSLVRRDVVARPSDPPGGFSRSNRRPASRTVPPAELLSRQRIADVLRHGKQLAILADTGRAVGVHLGMSGNLLLLPPRSRAPTEHVHAAWSLDDRSRLLFRDPRRFGGLWTFPSLNDLRARRWRPLGPDALSITPRSLHARLARTSRCVKAALLDQHLIAGVGNIYADEALFLARIAPHRRADHTTPDDASCLARALRRVLRDAIRAGGSTLRDYTDASGTPGTFQRRHHVYARAGLPCTRCRAPLAAAQIAQRTTVWCPRCQPLVIHISSPSSCSSGSSPGAQVRRARSPSGCERRV